MHASRADLPATVLGEYEGRSVDWGDFRLAFETMPASFPPDESPFAGLPDGRCQCPHWGYLLKGSFRVMYVDGPEEIVNAGDAGRGGVVTRTASGYAARAVDELPTRT